MLLGRGGRKKGKSEGQEARRRAGPWANVTFARRSVGRVLSASLPSRQIFLNPRLGGKKCAWPVGSASLVSRPRRRQRYFGSLQLWLTENLLGTRSSPQIFWPARFGCLENCSFLSAKYLSMASCAISNEGKSLL